MRELGRAVATLALQLAFSSSSGAAYAKVQATFSDLKYADPCAQDTRLPCEHLRVQGSAKPRRLPRVVTAPSSRAESTSFSGAP